MARIPLLKDLYYTWKGKRMYDRMLKKSCYWTSDSMASYQFEKLKYLLVESYDNIPYYRKLFDSLAFKPQTDFNRLTDLSRIPILNKEFAKKKKDLFVNSKYTKNAILFKTSGSTGVPFEILVHPNQWILEQGVVWRHWKWGGYNFRDPLAMVRSFVPSNEQTLWRTSKLSNFTYFSPFHLNGVNMAKYLDHMIARKIVILRGYPSSIATLADFVMRSGHAVPKIKLILTASEVLTDKDRSLIERAFATKVSNHYGLAEQIVMMGDCEKHEGLHNYDEYGYLELIDTEDPKVKRIIGTNLNNLTTPLIRYDTGDLASKLPHSLKLLRLWRNGFGRFSNVIANEHLIVDGEVSLLKNEIEHHDSPDLDHWFQKQNKYTTSEAEQRYFDNYLSFPPSFFKGRIQRRMCLKKYFYFIPFRYNIYFLYLYICLGTWRLGKVGYIWSRLRVDVFRFIEYKQFEMMLLKGPYRPRSSQFGSPDSRAIQL